MKSMSTVSPFPNTVIVDTNGNHYIVKNVSGAGDCALLSLLSNPNFHVPVSDCLELRWTIVLFAQGASREDCYTVSGKVGHYYMHFESYLKHVILWASMTYGCEIQSHFFNEF
jgi:hypothetical protein